MIQQVVSGGRAATAVGATLWEAFIYLHIYAVSELLIYEHQRWTFSNTCNFLRCSANRKYAAAAIVSSSFKRENIYKPKGKKCTVHINTIPNYQILATLTILLIREGERSRRVEHKRKLLSDPVPCRLLMLPAPRPVTFIVSNSKSKKLF